MDPVPMGMLIIAIVLVVSLAIMTNKPVSTKILYTSAINVIDGAHTTFMDYTSITYRLNGGKTTLQLDASGNLNMLSGNITSTGNILLQLEVYLLQEPLLVVAQSREQIYLLPVRLQVELSQVTKYIRITGLE
jgi:hypothetical protein